MSQDSGIMGECDSAGFLIWVKRNRIIMKRLLLIAPVFFGYYKDMILEAEELGYHVDYLCDAPSNSNISKALGRINKKLISGSAKRYYKEKALSLVEEEQYDKVLLVAGMSCAFTADMFCEMRRLQKQAEFILYPVGFRSEPPIL